MYSWVRRGEEGRGSVGIEGKVGDIWVG